MSITSRRIDKCPTPKQRFSDYFPTARTYKMTNSWQIPRGDGHARNWLSNYHHFKQIFFLFIGLEPTMWPANNYRQIMVCSCATLSNCVWLWCWLQIIFCSYVEKKPRFSPCVKMTDCFASQGYMRWSKLKWLLNSVIAKYCDLSLSSLWTDPPPLSKNWRRGICDSPSLIIYVWE